MGRMNKISNSFVGKGRRSGGAKSSGPKRRGYHHGNLKEALVAAAKQLILEKGPYGFSLVEAARYAGVSPAAPYRHYKDRDALLDDVAQIGFERFYQRLEKAMQNSEHPLQSLGEAYIRFADEERAFYSAMFAARPPHSGAQDAKDADSPDAQERFDRRKAFELLMSTAQKHLKPEGEMRSGTRLKQGSAQGRDQALGIDAERGMKIGLHIWALSHGIATLFLQQDCHMPAADENMNRTTHKSAGLEQEPGAAAQEGPGAAAQEDSGAAAQKDSGHGSHKPQVKIDPLQLLHEGVAIYLRGLRREGEEDTP